MIDLWPVVVEAPTLTWSPEPDLNRRPRPYQGRALPTELSGQTKTALQETKKSEESAGSILVRQQKFAPTAINPQQLRATVCFRGFSGSHANPIEPWCKPLSDPQSFGQITAKIGVHLIDP